MAWKNIRKRRIRFGVFWKSADRSFFLVRSIWLHKFINSFLQGGNKKTIIRFIFRAFVLLKTVGFSSPTLAVFEAMERSRSPVWAFRRKTGRGSVILVGLTPWWKQYMTSLRQFRHILTKNPEVKQHFITRLVDAINSIFNNPTQSAILKQKAAIYELTLEARLKGHFRWRA